MQAQGTLSKMQVQAGSPVSYSLRLDEGLIHLNEYIGKPITMNYLGEIQCQWCGLVTPKSFGEGYVTGALSVRPKPKNVYSGLSFVRHTKVLHAIWNGPEIIV